jgi:hypothetical protein
LAWVWVLGYGVDVARFVVLVVTLVGALFGAPRVRAEPPRPMVLIVIEGVPLAAAFRQRLARQLHAPVVSVAEAAAGAEQPAAMVGVKYDVNSGLAVAYLDRLGRTETLSIAVSDTAVLQDVAFGAASALLARHLPELTAADRAAPAALRGQLSVGEPLALTDLPRGWAPPDWYAVRPAKILLSLEDF